MTRFISICADDISEVDSVFCDAAVYGKLVDGKAWLILRVVFLLIFVELFVVDDGVAKPVGVLKLKGWCAGGFSKDDFFAVNGYCSWTDVVVEQTLGTVFEDICLKGILATELKDCDILFIAVLYKL